MKAAVSTRYGPPEKVLEIRDAPKPEPQAGEVQIRVHAATVTRTDNGMLRPHPWFVRFFDGLLRPSHTILGLDFAGVVEGLGEGAARFKQGDRVFGLAARTYGAHAETMCVPEDGAIALMPEGASFEQAVACEGAYYADSILKRFALKPGDKLLIYGGSGAIGSSAIQLAKTYGAEVTSVVPARHLDLVRSLGADRAIDYEAEDFTAIAERFDFVLDAVGKTTYFRCRRLLKPDGVYAATDLAPWAQNVWLALWSHVTKSGRVIFPMPGSSRGFPEYLKGLMETGAFRAVIDRKYTLDEIVEAYRYVASEQKTGIVVIEVAPASGA